MNEITTAASKGVPQASGEAFAEEQKGLRKGPGEEFELSEKLSCTVDAHGCVSVKTNRYSTPLRPETRAEVSLDCTHVTMLSGGEAVARHERSYSKRQEVLNLEHYLGVLEHKPGALVHSKALAQYRQTGLWPDSFDQLWAKLQQRHGASAGTCAMIRLLQHISTYGQARFRQAVETALACGSAEAEAVLHLLQPGTRAAHDITSLSGAGDGWERPLPQLTMYDQLLSAQRQTEVRP